MASTRRVYRANTSTHVDTGAVETLQLRHRLQLEIIGLARKVEDMQSADEPLDLSLRQTYREMIFSRRALLGKISR